MASSGISVSIAADPVSVNVREVGNEKIRDMLSSGSCLGGSGATLQSREDDDETVVERRAARPLATCPRAAPRTRET